MSLVRTVGLVTLVACGTSAPPPVATDAGTACEPRAVLACDCAGGRTGWATCSAAGKPGGCECGGTATTTDEDGGAPDACIPTTYYRDVDGDGFGSGVPTPACVPPVGYALVDGDCDDADARAHPGQTAYFATPATGGGFDFDCDGATTKHYVAGGACTAVSSGTCFAQGTKDYWELATTPECGVTAAWVLSCPFGCAAVTEQRAQGCR